MLFSKRQATSDDMNTVKSIDNSGGMPVNKAWSTTPVSRNDEPVVEKRIGPAEYREEVRRLIETEVKLLVEEEIRKACQEILDEQKKAIHQLVEENRAVIRLVVEEEKKSIWSRLEELRRRTLNVTRGD